MRNKLPKAVGAACAMAFALAALPGCKFFDLGNPLLPKARVLAVPNPTMVSVKAQLRKQDGVIDVQAADPVVTVKSYPRDASPGVLFTGYSAEYFDQANNAIPTLVLTKVSFGVAGYLPPASGANPSTVDLQLPIYNQQVRGYAIDQVYSFVPEPILNRNLIHTINCRVTLYGEDDNFNPIEVSLSVPIRFDGSISQ
jgi:hypothetical protein